MNIQQFLNDIGERVSTSASVKNVYGDPVVVGNRTVIPAAQVRYGFGGGGSHAQADEREGSGGGGGVMARPCGALEIKPESTRFIVFGDQRRMGAALALGFLVGAAMVALSGGRRVEITKRQPRSTTGSNIQPKQTAQHVDLDNADDGLALVTAQLDIRSLHGYTIPDQPNQFATEPSVGCPLFGCS